MKLIWFLLLATFLTGFQKTTDHEKIEEGRKAHSFAVQITLSKERSEGKGAPVVEVRLSNKSEKTLTVVDSDAFSDYQIEIASTDGRQVPPTDEALAIKKGEDTRIGSSKVHTLLPGGSSLEFLDLQRFFAIKTPGTYRLSVRRKFQDPPDDVTSNSLVIELRDPREPPII